MEIREMHLPILKAFDELKFSLGKKTMLDFLKGDINKSIEKNNLDELNAYGSMYMVDKSRIEEIMDDLIAKGYLEIDTVNGHFKVVKRTKYGLKEIFEKKYVFDENSVVKAPSNKAKFKFKYKEEPISEQDRALFGAFGFFLDRFNEKQKKVIISASKSILCVAGAGSGKTTVLTKRIEFLTKYRGVQEKKILAITFTRKAKEEMKNRLAQLGVVNAKVETFNSFCEKYLKKYGDKIYEREVKVISYRDKIVIVKDAMRKLKVHFELLKDDYFNKRQLREKSSDELFFLFVNDVFSIMDYYKNVEDEIKPFYENAVGFSQKNISKQIYFVAKWVSDELKRRGLRDFSDQIIDAIELFKKNPELVPVFDHVLVDEFQDVNKTQIDLLKMLKYENIFAVGDPRQAIYGWRGSEIRYILDFPEIFTPQDTSKTQVVELEMNYRSNERIVSFFNSSIKSMGLAELKSGKVDTEFQLKNSYDIFLIEQDSELLERRFVLEAIKNSKNPRNEIFVLARTNRVLSDFADFFARNGVRFTIKNEEEYKNGELKEDEVVLATVHSIKGMEANEVYLVGCNSLSFPNKVQDNFVFSLVKNDSEYDKDAEELRLFYVAISRAKDKLILTYTGNYTKFITKDMLEKVKFKGKNKSLFTFGGDKDLRRSEGNSNIVSNMLREWRAEKGRESSLPLYMIISNAAIDDISSMMPQTRAELYKAKGMGDAKIAKYGDEILKVVNGGN